MPPAAQLHSAVATEAHGIVCMGTVHNAKLHDNSSCRPHVSTASHSCNHTMQVVMVAQGADTHLTVAACRHASRL